MPDIKFLRIAFLQPLSLHFLFLIGARDCRFHAKCKKALFPQSDCADEASSLAVAFFLPCRLKSGRDVNSTLTLASQATLSFTDDTHHLTCLSSVRDRNKQPATNWLLHTESRFAAKPRLSRPPCGGANLLSACSRVCAPLLHIYIHTPV